MHGTLCEQKTKVFLLFKAWMHLHSGSLCNQTNAENYWKSYENASQKPIDENFFHFERSMKRRKEKRFKGKHFAQSKVSVCHDMAVAFTSFDSWYFSDVKAHFFEQEKVLYLCIIFLRTAWINTPELFISAQKSEELTMRKLRHCFHNSFCLKKEKKSFCGSRLLFHSLIWP